METRSQRRLEATQDKSRQVPLHNSLPGSGGSCVSKSSSKVLSARVQLLKAKLREMQARHEVEAAELGVKIAQINEDEDDCRDADCADIPVEKEDQLSRYVADCHRMSGTGFAKEIDDERVQPEYKGRLEMPKVEISFFDGNPGDYWRFSKEFGYYIENRVKDNGQRLLYLLYYCRGRAKSAIQDCVVLPPDSAYSRARQILHDLFGETHVVARARIDRLLKGLKPIAEDGEALSLLAIEMQNCNIALTEMNYTADLNSVATMEKIIRVLPVAVRRNWARFADGKLQEESEPLFNDLCQFVANEARISRSRYGYLVHENVARPDKFGNSSRPYPKSDHFKTTSFEVQATSTSVGYVQCILCNLRHRTDCCKKFLNLKVPERWRCVRRGKACYLCLGVGHRVDSCTSPIKCVTGGCQKRHHPLLHSEAVTHQATETGLCAAAVHEDSKVMLGVIPVRVRGKSVEVNTYALLDCGSDTTLISSELVESLKLDTIKVPMSLSTVNGSKLIDSSLSSFDVLPLDGGDTIHVERAFSVPRLPVRAPGISLCSRAQHWPHLRDLPLVEVANKDVSLLIGCDVPEAHWTLEQRIGKRKQPYAVRTLLGWVVRGTLGGNGLSEAKVNCTQLEENEVSEQLERLYHAEFQDIENLERAYSMDDLKAINIVSTSSGIVDGHFVVPLPWKHETKVTMNNFLLARQRLLYLGRRLGRDKLLQERYAAAMNRSIEKGYVSEVGADQMGVDYSPRWYLPHHPVVNPKKPEKLRIVLDCAAKFQGVSLNDRLLSGPDWTAELVGVLLRFRTEPIAMVADIEDMFMQVRVPLQDRGALRFLWWPNGDLNAPPVEYQMVAHPFGAKSSPFCANFALRKTVEVFGHLYPENIGNVVLKNFYVDDCLACVSSLNEAKEVVQGVRELLKVGGFTLKRWMSNMPEVLDTVPLLEQAETSRAINEGRECIERTLGLEWNAETDSFRFRIVLPEGAVTRRGILSAVSSIFDPLGIICPMTLPAKIILQKLCGKGIGWDEDLPSDEQLAWKRWVNAVGKIPSLEIPRCFKGKHYARDSRLQLHVFCDASDVGYGAAAYIRVHSEDELVHCILLFAKARVAPLKRVTIPRLELTAAVLGIRVFELIKRNMNVHFEAIHFWTDSKTVLYYINNSSKRFSSFVANRLTIIHQSSLPSQWNHVRSGDNVADLASRGTLDPEKIRSWFQGPDFLRQLESLWPRTIDSIDSPPEVELKRVNICVNVVSRSDCLIDLFERYGEWVALLKGVSWIIRFKQFMIMKKRDPSYTSLNRGPLTVRELSNAAVDIIRLVQTEQFPREFQRLRMKVSDDNSAAIPKNSQLRGLYPILVNGLICVGGRLDYTNYSQTVKHPPILPKGHWVTELIIRHYHMIEGHCGASQLLATIRRNYWIVQGGAAVKRVIGRCVVCRRRSAGVCQQLMAPVPAVRAEVGWYPFRYIGLDYFGPFQVKRGRAREKRYGCIFTCLQTRAVHLEVSHSLSTDAFIMSLTRFIGRRGRPDEIYSDNGTNFVGAVKELREFISKLDQRKINEHLMARDVQWHFQPPSSSHRGGIWERMIRSARHILNALCNEQLLDDETLVTLMVEAERILNDRPLVPITSDSQDQLALCPSQIMLLRGNAGVFQTDELKSAYNKGWRQAVYLGRVFWSRWVREYIPLLQKRHKWLLKSRNLQKGDVVIVVNELSPRKRWPLGVVDDFESSGDGLVRTVILRTKDGLIKRDIRKVCLLEGVTS